MWSGFIFLVCLVPALAKSSNLLRINYGVTFKHEGLLDNGAQRWMHTFVVDLPSATFVQSHLSCSQQSGITCSQYEDIVNIINGQRQKIATAWKQVEEDLNDLIPGSSDSRNKAARSTGLVTAVGDMTKMLFGSATTADYEVLQRNMYAVKGVVDALTHDASVRVNDMSSFSRLMNREFINMDTNLEQIQSILHMDTDDLINMSKDLEEVGRDISLLLAYSSANFTQAMMKLQALSRGLFALSRGKLTQDLIPPPSMQVMMAGIARLLHKDHPDFHLIGTSLSLEYFYNLGSIAAIRYNNRIYLTVFIPVSSSSTLLSLYRTEAFPLLYRQNSSHATLVEDLPEYFAVAQDNSGFVEIGRDTMKMCRKMDGVFTCPRLLAMAAPSTASCLWAVYRDDKVAAHEQCRNSLVVQGLKSFLLELEPGTILMSNVQHPITQCYTEAKNLKPCKQCVVKLPCECSLQTDTFFLPDVPKNCEERNAEVTVLHPTNLNLLLHFLNASSLEGVSGSSLFETAFFPTLVPAPHFSEEDLGKYPELMEKHPHLNLKPILAKTAKSDRVLINPLQAKTAKSVEKDGSVDRKHDIAIASIVASILAFLLSVCSLLVVKGQYTRMMIFR